MRVMGRRQFIGAKTETCHIISLVVQCLPDKIAAVAAAISDIPDAEIPTRDERGKLVVLIETNGEARLMERISAIESVPGVISATMVYHQVDE
jgi:nitrate reductase NapD